MAAAQAAERAARVSGDPVLINAGLDAVRTAATTAGRLRDAHRVSAGRLALLTEIDRDDPAAACLARARGRLGDLAALETALEGWRRIGASFEYACTLSLRSGRSA